MLGKILVEVEVDKGRERSTKEVNIIRGRRMQQFEQLESTKEKSEIKKIATRIQERRNVFFRQLENNFRFAPKCAS